MKDGVDVYLLNDRPVFLKTLRVNLSDPRKHLAMQMVFLNDSEFVVGTDNGEAHIWSIPRAQVIQTLTYRNGWSMLVPLDSVWIETRCRARFATLHMERQIKCASMHPVYPMARTFPVSHATSVRWAQ